MKKMISSIQSEKGFTLIEMLVVVAVVGILAAAVVSGIDPSKRFKEARDSQRKQIIGNLATAMETCFTKNNGAYANCDAFTELKPEYIKVDYTGYSIPNGGSSTDFAISATAGIGCVSAKLESPVTAGSHWKYASDKGYAEESATSC